MKLTRGFGNTIVAFVVISSNVASAEWTTCQPSTQRQVANNRSASVPTGIGGTTYYTNPNGSSAGKATQMGNTTYYYNANGSAAGSATRVGNTTYYYNAKGSAAGTATRAGR